MEIFKNLCKKFCEYHPWLRKLFKKWPRNIQKKKYNQKNQ